MSNFTGRVTLTFETSDLGIGDGLNPKQTAQEVVKHLLACLTGKGFAAGDFGDLISASVQSEQDGVIQLHANRVADLNTMLATETT